MTEPDTPSGSELTNLPVFDREAALRYLDGSEFFLQEFLGEFLAVWTDRIATMQQAIVRAEWTELERSVHTLRNLLGLLGAVSAMEQAREVESIIRDGRFDEVRPATGRFFRGLEEFAQTIRVHQRPAA